MRCTSDFGRPADFNRISCAIGVMAKAPRPGFSKTRLCPPLTPVDAAALSAAFLRDISENIALAALETPIAGYIAYAPAGQEALFDGHLAAGTGLLLADGSPPVPSDVQGFGRCLLHAIRALLAPGHRAAVVLNSDSPTLPTSLLVHTARVLALEGDRIVLGPAEDGGYYLLGMKAAHAHLFADIAWSTDTVAETTRQRARQLGVEIVELPAWYDVDDEAALIRLVRETSNHGALADAPRRYPASPCVTPMTAATRAVAPHPSPQNSIPESVGTPPETVRPAGNPALAYPAGEPAHLQPYPAPFTARALASMGFHADSLDLAAE